MISTIKQFIYTSNQREIRPEPLPEIKPGGVTTIQIYFPT
jgi:hypothetical protein